MILCHKCSGLLEYHKAENIKGLRPCECISGWVRGFESNLNREQAIMAQAERQECWAKLYTNQKRSKDQIDYRLNERDRLLSLL